MKQLFLMPGEERYERFKDGTEEVYKSSGEPVTTD